MRSPTGLNLDVQTLQNYERSLRLHILPRFGHRSMRAIAASDIAKWKLDCAESGYAHSTISGWVNLLSMILTDAADEGLIEANPVRKLRRRGKRVWSARPERIWATPRQIRRVADQAAELGGPIARLLIITAAWTGCRWGESAGLHRRNVDLELGVIKIDREVGALHEDLYTALGEAWSFGAFDELPLSQCAPARTRRTGYLGGGQRMVGRAWAKVQRLPSGSSAM